MEKRLAVLFLIGSMLSSRESAGQSSQTIIWNTFQFPIRLSEKWQWHNDISYRAIGVSASAYQYTFRTGVRRFINDKWNVATGVALFYTRTSFDKMNHEFGREFRLWQEVVNEKKLNRRFRPAI